MTKNKKQTYCNGSKFVFSMDYLKFNSYSNIMNKEKQRKGRMRKYGRNKVKFGKQ